MRKKAIISGAIAALAIATLTANAGSLANHRLSGSVVSLVAATTTVTKADRDAEATDEQSAAPATKPVVAVKPAVPRVIARTPACQQAIDTLKALHQADVTEGVKERAGAPALSASARQADRDEDAAEAQQWRKALAAARTACAPQPVAACQDAIAGLQTLLQARTEELSERIDLLSRNWPVELASQRTAVGTVVSACVDRD